MYDWRMRCSLHSLLIWIIVHGDTIFFVINYHPLKLQKKYEVVYDHLKKSTTQNN